MVVSERRQLETEVTAGLLGSLSALGEGRDDAMEGDGARTASRARLRRRDAPTPAPRPGYGISGLRNLPQPR